MPAFVQDKVCTPWSGTVVAADVLLTVFTNNINQNIVGTGYLQYDVGPDVITFDLLNSAGVAMITPITISPGSSLSFTYRRFRSIRFNFTRNNCWHLSRRVLHNNPLSSPIKGAKGGTSVYV